MTFLKRMMIPPISSDSHTVSQRDKLCVAKQGPHEAHEHGLVGAGFPVGILALPADPMHVAAFVVARATQATHPPRD